MTWQSGCEDTDLEAISNSRGNICSSMASVSRAKDFSGSTTSVFYYFSDHLKMASVITDSAGTIKAESDYYPWGGELQFVNNDSNHYKFTGKERDSETGLDYFGARYYGNWLGRFITPDWNATPVPVPYADLTDPQTLNQYSYVRNIPTSKADVDGQDPPDPPNNPARVATGPIMTPGMAEAAGRFWNWLTSGPAHDPRPPHVPTLPSTCPNPCPRNQNNDKKDGKENNNSYQQNTKADQLKENAAKGKEFEKSALDKEGLSKNTKGMQATDPKTGQEGTTIPDSVRQNGQTVDAKAGSYVSDSKQLRLQSEVSQQSGQKAQVIVKPGTKVSKTVQDRMDVKEQK